MKELQRKGGRGLRRVQGQTNVLLMLFPDHTRFFPRVPEALVPATPTALGEYVHICRAFGSSRCPGVPPGSPSCGGASVGVPASPKPQQLPLSDRGACSICAPRQPCSGAASPSPRARRTWKTPGNVPALWQIHVLIKTRCRPTARPHTNLIEMYFMSLKHIKCLEVNWYLISIN